jgi:hypothetical protein
MARDLQRLALRDEMVVYIDEYLQKVREAAFRVAKVASPFGKVGPDPDDDGPSDDPPSAIQLAA